MRAVKMGVAGLGQGAAGMIPSMSAMPEIDLVAGADLNAQMRAGFLERFPGTRVYESVAALCADPELEAVYVGTPNRFHCEHALEAMRNGKHVVVEKPMAITLEEADKMVEASAKFGVKLLAAHTRAYTLWHRAARKIVLSGALGRIRAIHVWAYTDWMIRPRTADELDPNQGGGIVYRQGPHQVDTVRLLGGGRLRSVRGMTGRWMPERPVDGYFSAYLEFEDGTAATVMHNGYGYFSMDDLYPWVVTKRKYTYEDRAALRRGIREGTRREDDEKAQFRVGGAHDPTVAARKPGGAQDWSPFDVGPVEISCERGIIRMAQRGLHVYDDNGMHEVNLDLLWRPIPDPSGGLSIAVLEELYAAIVHGKPVYHGAEWGRATLEAVLAIMQSAREHREIVLERQVEMPLEYDADLQIDAQALVRS